jgi:hypothetical protein
MYKIIHTHFQYNEGRIGLVYHFPKNDNMENLLKPILIRSYPAGVYFGLLKSLENATMYLYRANKYVIVLVNARQILAWDGAECIQEIGLKWANWHGCKFSDEITEIKIDNVIEYLMVTPEALKRIEFVFNFKIYDDYYPWTVADEWDGYDPDEKPYDGWNYSGSGYSYD